jgi:hypothetical protein
MKSNLIFLVLVIAVLAYGYYWFTENLSVTGEVSYDQVEIFGKDFLLLSERIEKIKLDPSFLQSEAFLSLKDLTPVIEYPFETEIGKFNPFLPIIPPSPSPTPRATTSR